MVAFKANIISLAAALFVASPVLGMYDKGSAVKQLGPSNFERVLGKTSQPTFVKFYAPWCGHCKTLEPEFERAAQKTQGIARFYAVDCDQDKNRGLCAQFDVKGFPTLKVFTEKRTKRGTRRSVDYQGERKASAMAKYVRSMLPNLSKKLASDELNGFVASGKLPKAVLLTERAKTSELWKGISAQFDRRVQFAHISNPEKSALERLGVSELPAIVVFPNPADTSLFNVYNGETKYAPLAQFISSAVSEKKAKVETTAKPDVQITQSVEEIANQADLERHCINPADSSQVPVLCIIGIVPLESEYEESRSEHAQAVNELQAVLERQLTRNSNVSTAASDDDNDDEDGGKSEQQKESTVGKAGFPFRVSWVNALSDSGRRIRDMFGLSDDLPSAVIINPRKSASAPYRGVFAGDDILEWANACYQGHHMQRFMFDLDISSTQPDKKAAEAAHEEL
ncbi:hypothetical protein LPJ66_004063 [Kickxella alabastrina]|uniref:Uncharacterized protein n=1 Tax=Kickxella alabastrina TaxID=61397 RepID=A0ACC1INV9_9FUNG|nr:hypothetical protein LPJ66_004063 [Kickxella alabastrina]